MWILHLAAIGPVASSQWCRPPEPCWRLTHADATGRQVHGASPVAPTCKRRTVYGACAFFLGTMRIARSMRCRTLLGLRSGWLRRRSPCTEAARHIRQCSGAVAKRLLQASRTVAYSFSVLCSSSPTSPKRIDELGVVKLLCQSTFVLIVCRERAGHMPGNLLAFSLSRTVSEREVQFDRPSRVDRFRGRCVCDALKAPEPRGGTDVNFGSLLTHRCRGSVDLDTSSQFRRRWLRTQCAHALMQGPCRTLHTQCAPIGTLGHMTYGVGHLARSRGKTRSLVRYLQ
jgi:hypothetical protein